MKPTLSIIIPCYNCQDTLEEAVESCFVQGLDNFEIVMVDDGSTDDTRKVMSGIADKHSEIKLFYHDKNKGGGATRNTAVENSQSDVIFCLDSDDILPEGTLSKMLSFMRDKKCDGATVHKSIKFSGKNVEHVHHVDIACDVDKKISLASMLSVKKEFVPIYVNFMYTKRAFDKLGGYPVSHGYDTQGFAWRFVCVGLVAYVCPGAEYLHRVNYSESYFLREYNDGKMNYNWRAILLEHYYVFNKTALDFMCNFDCSDFTRNIMSELVEMGEILLPGHEKAFLEKHADLEINFSTPRYIKRNSFYGYFLRIKSRIRRAFSI